MTKATAIRRRAVAVVASALAVSALAACSPDYLDHRESVSLGGGNAQAVNAATHIVNPLPPGSADRQLLINGQVVQKGVQRYRTGQTIEEKAPSTN